LHSKLSANAFLYCGLGMTCQEFDEALSEAVDSAFRSLGPSCQQALRFHLKMTFRLARRNIPKRIEDFDEALRFSLQRRRGATGIINIEKTAENGRQAIKASKGGSSI
jgi:hypothetical protein